MKPDFASAIKALSSFRADNVDFAEALDHFSKTGLPLFVCEIDPLATDAAGDLVFSYKLSDKLEVSLAAVRAGNLHAENIGV